jgi:DNA primase
LWASPSTGLGHYTHRQDFLLSRGLTRSICINNCIGHTGEAFSIPIYDEARRVVSIRYRRDDVLANADRPKYWGTAGANQAMLYIPVGPRDISEFGVVLCEGELDALLLAQYGYPAVSLTNGCNALKEEHVPQLKAYARSLGTNRVTVVYDQDEPGHNAAERINHYLDGTMKQPVHWDLSLGKDVTEFICRNGGLAFYLLLERAWL